MGGTPKAGGVVSVRVLSTEGCANTPPTLERIREVADELGLAIDLATVVVTTREEAEALRFLGSPTVQLDGRDLEPAARGATGWGFSWRMYGASGVPTAEMIRDGLREAAGR